MFALLEFDWGNKTITKKINTTDLFNDIANNGNIWFNFDSNGVFFKFQVNWKCNLIAIYLVHTNEKVFEIDNFNLYFSKNLK